MAGPNTIAFQGSNETANASTSEIPVSKANPLPTTLGSGSISVGNITGNLSVEGVAAAGALNTGINPVKAGGAYNSTLPVATSGNLTDFQTDANGNLLVSIAGVIQTGSDAKANTSGVALLRNPGSQTTVGILEVLGALFNGATLDRMRSIQGIDGSGLGVVAVEESGASFVNITTATTTTVKSGAGTLHKIVVNTQVASATIAIFGNTTAVAPKIGNITLPSTITGSDPLSLEYDLYFTPGLTIVTSGATDITVVYR